MRPKHRLLALSTILWCLTGWAWAAPRVAIVTPVSGTVWLGDLELKTPRLVEEGQKLLTGDNSKARVQLLGSSKEILLEANSILIVKKAELEKTATTVSRGSLSVVEEIGSINKSASANARKEGYKTNYVVGFLLELPPVRTERGWQARVLTPPDQFNLGRGEKVTLTLEDMTDPQVKKSSVVVENYTDHLIFEQDLVEGHRYELHVQGPRSGYYRQFQILSADDRAEMTRTAKAIRAEALQNNELATLLQLANLYFGFDETEKLAEVLSEVMRQPSFQELDEATKIKIKESLDLTRRSLDLKNLDENI
jgi:hypothetical protein